MDSYAIASALATLYKATTPPTGEESIKVATADLAEAPSYFPTMFILPPRLAEPTYITKGRSLPLDYPAILLLDKADGSARRAALMHKWINALYPRLGTQLQLGLSSYVALATLTSIDAGTVRYEGLDFDGITLTNRVLVSESYDPVA
jgi:hypothetical protein